MTSYKTPNTRWQEIVKGIADEVWICDAQGKISLLNLEAVILMAASMRPITIISSYCTLRDATNP